MLCAARFASARSSSGGRSVRAPDVAQGPSNRPTLPAASVMYSEYYLIFIPLGWNDKLHAYCLNSVMCGREEPLHVIANNGDTEFVFI